MYQYLPFIEIPMELTSCWEGWDAIDQEIRRAISRLNKPKVVIAVECYHGTLDESNFFELKKRLQPSASCKASDLFRESEALQGLIRRRMADESRPGKFTGLTVRDYFDPQKLLAIQHSISLIVEGAVLVYGIGASLVWKPDLLIYADMSHWEIQQRLRRGDIGNIGLQNAGAAFDQKYEIAFFNDWQVCDQLKRGLLHRCDYFLETNNWAKPKLATGAIVRRGLEQATRQPIKMAPFFDPELWDHPSEQNGQSSPPQEWGFSCVPEEDNLLFRFGEMLFETPLLNLIFYRPESFLGPEVVRKFGAYLPVRFNFIDTTENQDVEFLVNPVAQEIVDGLGCRYRQATGYYMLQAPPGAKIELAEPNRQPSIQRIKELGLQQHDFIQIPTDTPYRAGKQLTALQINTAPQIFSLKLSPGSLETRPGIASSEAVRRSGALVEQEEVLSEEVILLSRVWFSQDMAFHTNETVQILLLVAGQAAVVESPAGSFQPFLARYGETFIIPAQVGPYRVRPLGGSTLQLHALLRATVGAG